jgi:Tfp pilus assembly protein PilF
MAMILDQRIELARRHVEKGRLIVARQQALVAQGRTGPTAIELLALFERLQEIFEDDLARFIKERGEK